MAWRVLFWRGVVRYEGSVLKTKCLFCGEEITPEEGFDDARSKDGVYYIFQCNNIYCDARYESFGQKIPRIDVQVRPRVLEEYLEGFL